MNSTHTPGPWDVSFGRNDAAIHAGGTIAMIDDVMTGWRANARLIAAAPELLAALEAAHTSLSAWVDYAQGDISDDDNETLDMIVAAIAKAKGS